MSKGTKQLIIFVSLIFSFSVNSTLITSNLGGEDVVVDSQQGLIWLNWVDSFGITRTDMELNLLENGNFADWRYATFDEMSALVEQVFPSLPLINTMIIDNLQSSDYFDPAFSHEVIVDDLEAFNSLFGSVRGDSKFLSASAYFGDVVYGLEGGGLLYDAAQVIVIMDGLVDEPSFEDRISLYSTGLDSQNFSHALVKVVPVHAPSSTLLLLLCCVLTLFYLSKQRL